MSTEGDRAPRLPPRWFIRAFWAVHRAMYRASGHRFGLRRARPGRWGMLALTTRGRSTGRTHRVIVGYLEDGPNLITMAMNGWGEGEPAWWLNLQASPETRVELADGHREIRARAAQGAERAQLWAAWRQLDPNLDGYAKRRSSETAVVVLEPRDADVSGEGGS
ncbi:MAG TPA: nitroreductase/quinone reductase family protein [Actinomycetota bacterium]|nr:nitroreductase/quinone reductase family protein [Actinomycetota bacterium]